MTELLEQVEYEGECRGYANLESAITFLESIRTATGELDHADLILCEYNVEGNDGLKMFEMLKKCNNGGALEV